MNISITDPACNKEKIIKQNIKNQLKKNRRYVKFFIYVFLIEIIYISLHLIEPLRKHLGDNGIILKNFNLFLLVVILLLINLLLYALGYKEIIKNNIKLKTIILCFLLFSLTLLFIWPIGSTDIFSIYISRPNTIRTSL